MNLPFGIHNFIKINFLRFGLLYLLIVCSSFSHGQVDSLPQHHLSLNFGFNAAFSKYYTIQSGYFEEKDNVLFYNGSIKYDYHLTENTLLDISYTFDPIRVSTGGSYVEFDSTVFINNGAATSAYYERGYFLQDYIFYHQALDLNFQIFKRGKNAQKGFSFTTGVGVGLVTVPNKSYPVYPGAMDPSIDLHNEFSPLVHTFEYRNYVYMRINMGLQYLLPLNSKWSMIFAAHDSGLQEA